MGYSLTQNYEEVEIEVDANQKEQMSERHQSTLQTNIGNQTPLAELNEQNATGDEILKAKAIE